MKYEFTTVLFLNLKFKALYSLAMPSIDLLDPVSELLVGSNIILPGNPADTAILTILATRGIPREGVAADGVAKLVIRFNAPSVGTVSFILVDQNGLPLSDHEGEGILSDLQKTSFDSFTVNTLSTSQGHKAFALYTAPSNFVRASRPDANVNKREVYIKTRFVSATGQVVERQPIPVKIIRPLVFLVHGIWSYSLAWTNFNPLISDSKFLVFLADYPNDQHFETAANAVYLELKASFSRYKKSNNVAAVQADVVAHSMGGPVVRTMALRSDYLDDRSFCTFGKGPIRRLITIDAVHLGTRIGNYLLSHQCVANFLTNDLGLPTGNGAVEDLADGSMAFKTINA